MTNTNDRVGKLIIDLRNISVFHDSPELAFACCLLSERVDAQEDEPEHYLQVARVLAALGAREIGNLSTASPEAASSVVQLFGSILEQVGSEMYPRKTDAVAA